MTRWGDRSKERRNIEIDPKEAKSDGIWNACQTQEREDGGEWIEVDKSKKENLINKSSEKV